MDPLPGFSRFGGPLGGNLCIFVARECFGKDLGAILGALGPILGALEALLGRIFDVCPELTLCHEVAKDSILDQPRV